VGKLADVQAEHQALLKINETLHGKLRKLEDINASLLARAQL